MRERQRQGGGWTTLTFSSRCDFIHPMTQAISTQSGNPSGNFLGAYLFSVYKMTCSSLGIQLKICTVRNYTLGAGDGPHLGHTSLQQALHTGGM